jgi:hypothetical protein
MRICLNADFMGNKHYLRDIERVEELQMRFDHVAQDLLVQEKHTDGILSCILSYTCRDPMGIILAEGSEDEDLIYADINLQRLVDVRNKVPSISHRRAELYR